MRERTAMAIGFGVSEPPFRLRTFGRPELCLYTAQAGRAVVGAVQQKHLAVLTYIALSPERRASRRILSSLLWSDTADSDDRHGLRSSLSLLRSSRALGPDAISSGDRESVALSAPIWIDCVEFERLVGTGDYETAVTLYTGPFFKDWALPGCEGFEDWAEGKRNHFSTLFCSAAREVCRRLSDAGRAAAAVSLAERVRDENPLDPEHWRLLIETRVAARDFIGAAAEAEKLERMSESEGLVLDKPMRALLRRSRDHSAVSSADTIDDGTQLLAPAMVGREYEFSTLIRAWDRVASGRLTHVQLVSAPGLGKSRLLQELAARLHAKRARVVAVRGDAVLRGVDFGLVARLTSLVARLPGSAALAPTTTSILLGLDPSLGEVFREAAPTFPPAHDALRLRASALRDLIRVVSAERPLAVIVDDLHWCDASSLQVLSAALAQLEDAPLLTVSSTRPGIEWGPSQLAHLELLPLSGDAVREMLRSLAALPEEPWADRFAMHLHEITRGSPFLVLQALSLALDEGLVQLRDGFWACPDIEAFISTSTGDAIVSSRVGDISLEERFALLVVGFAARSLSSAQIDALVRSALPESTALETLERRRLIERRTGFTTVAHDEILEAVLDIATKEEQAEARRALAKALGQLVTPDADRLREIGMHLAAAGSEEELKRLFVSFLDSKRAAGDSRPALELAIEFRGAAVPAAARALVAALPASKRGPRLMRALTLSAIAAAVAASIVMILPQSFEPDQAKLWVVPGEASSAAENLVARVRTDEWLSDAAISLREVGAVVSGEFTGAGLQRPSHREWSFEFEAGDSSGAEIGLYSAREGSTRLTNSFGEDAPTGWSPDGRFLLLSTSRYSTKRHRRTAVLDVESMSLRELTANDWYEHTPAWSPDGTRIAFLRRSFDQSPNELCWVATAGGDAHCLSLSGIDAVELAAWLSPTMVMVTADSAQERRLYSVQLEGGQRTQVAIPATFGSCSTSADFVWIACPPFVAPTARIERWRKMGSGVGADALVRWEVASRTPWMIDSLRIVTLSKELLGGVPHRLSVRIHSAASVDTVHPTLIWSSSDTSIASVASDGTVSAHRRGRVRVSATVGGWRSDSLVLDVASAPRPNAVSGGWQNGTEQWWLFGEPLPTVVESSTGPALLVAGDGHYFSGAVLRRSLPIERGVGFEATVSTPLNMMQWQYLQLGFVVLDSSWRTADAGRDAYLAHVRGMASCLVSFPTTEGRSGIRNMSGLRELLPAKGGSPYPTLADGRPWRLRVQVLPDGRCGIAVNGVPVKVGSVLGGWPPRVNLLVQGHSVGTRIAIGDFRYWAGVPDDVDWSRVRTWRDVPGLLP